MLSYFGIVGFVDKNSVLICVGVPVGDLNITKGYLYWNGSQWTSDEKNEDNEFL